MSGNQDAHQINYFKASLRDNAELLLNEVLKAHRNPLELPRYLQQLLMQLRDVDNDFRNQYYQRALEASKQDYQLAEQNYNPTMLTNFPQQNFKIVGGAQIPSGPPIKVQQQSSVYGQRPLTGPTQASIATSHDAKPNKIVPVQQAASPGVARAHQRTNDARTRSLDAVLAKPHSNPLQRQSSNSPSQQRKPIPAVLHKHPLHVEKRQANTHRPTSEDIHSFASIVKTQQKAASREPSKPVSPTYGDKPLMTQNPTTREEANEADESLKAYADELARDAIIDDQPRRYASTGDYDEKDDDIKTKIIGSKRGSTGLQPNVKDGYASNLSKRTGSSKRSHATMNSRAHQQLRLDNLILISKGVQEKVF